jgi:hypothetical protein
VVKIYNATVVKIYNATNSLKKYLAWRCTITNSNSSTHRLKKWSMYIHSCIMMKW